LSAQLFNDGALRAFYQKAKARFEPGNRILRVRLFVGPTAAPLHGLRWELLADPDGGLPLAFTERMLFSRFIGSADWRSVKLRPKAELRAVIAVSGPTDLEGFGLAPVDVDAEIAGARAGLGQIPVPLVLGKRETLTLDRLIDALRDGPDIVYLVCHGVWPEGAEPALFLQTEDGKTTRVKAGDLAARIAALNQMPRLMVLASCQSAGRGGSADAFRGLAPRLAEAGVPAIVGMQSNVQIETVKLMMPVFFRELLVDGQIDRAMAAARAVVTSRSDSWVPALYLRLRGGKIWYVRGFAGQDGGFEQMDSICNFVRDGTFLPVLGPNLAEHIYGNSRDMALELAQESGYPFGTADRTDMAKVTQYISVKSSPKAVRTKYRDALFAKLKQKAASLLGAGNLSADAGQILAALVKELAKDPDDPMRILAELDAGIFLTANPDPLLELFLQAIGKTPQELTTAWRNERGQTPRTAPCNPVPQSPIVYYVYGKTKYEDSWVLTEDDFFDFLIRMYKYDLMPLVVGDALTSGSLLFLGFPLDDWKFRILFRMIMAKGGRQLLQDFNHVGVQVNPEENTYADAARARKYLEGYFRDARIDIYWGSSADFLKDLRDRMKVVGALQSASSGAL
jgi:hypothetical protein